MKILSQILFRKMSKAFVTNITVNVEETLSKEFGNSQRKVFSSADLWNIQRRRTSVVIR